MSKIYTESDINQIKALYKIRSSDMLKQSPKKDPLQENYENLANAIVEKAVSDYRSLTRGPRYENRTTEAEIRQIERFFRSGYFKLLTKIDGEWLLDKLRKEAQAINDKG